MSTKRKRESHLVPRKSRKLSPSPVQEASPRSDAPNDFSDNDNDAGDEWTGISTQPHQQTSSTSSSMPTTEQIKTMRDANELFRSSSFKLQIDALLPNVRPKFSKSAPLDQFLMNLHSVFDKLPSVPPSHPLSAAKKLKKKGVSVLYCDPQPTEDTKWVVAFEKPTEISLVGSWPNKMAVKGKDSSHFGVDVVVEMPSSLFQEKDYLDGRFFQKRAFYLASLATFLQDRKHGVPDTEVSYECLSGDIRQSRLVLVSKSTDSTNNFTEALNVQVNVIPVLSDNSPIPRSRLSPSHSNIRDPQTQEHLSSPLYNNIFLMSTAFFAKSHLLITYQDKQSCAAFEDAVALLRIWANQRSYCRSLEHGILGFDGKGYFWAALLHYLLVGDQSQPQSKSNSRRPLGRGLSSYQLFRGALDFLAKHDFAVDPIFTKCHQAVPQFSPSDHQSVVEEGIPVFVDSTSTINLLSGVSLGSLDLLREDARQTLDLLNESQLRDPFKDLFLKDRRDLATRFDVVLNVDLTAAKPRAPLNAGARLDSASSFNALIASILSVLRRGLGKRAKAITCVDSALPCFPTSQSTLPSRQGVVCIGLVLNPEKSFPLVDHGPSADDPDPTHAEAFRELWGPKAELRRFQDGRIVESVVWDITAAEERTHIPAMIVSYLLSYHFNLPEEAITRTQPAFDRLIKLPEPVSSKISRYSTDVKPGFASALTAFNELIKSMKRLGNDLPLTLVNVSAVSPSLRYTSVLTPAPLPAGLLARLPPTAQYVPPLEIVLEFEKSSKWPDDLKAIQKLKLAFFETIASGLMGAIEGLQAHVVIGNGVTDSQIVDQGSLVIVSPDGWAFSARIWHDREATLLDRIVEDKAKMKKFPAFRLTHQGGVHDQHGSQEVAHAKEVHVRRFIHRPRHHRAIAALCHHYSAYSGTVRLVKRWLSSHWLLDGHVTEEAVEMLCAQFFVTNKSLDQENRSHSSRIPVTKERGFACVIEFMKEWRWEEDDLDIPLYSHSSVPGDAPGLPSELVKHGVWKIVTEADPQGKMWTCNFPQVVSANRIRTLAQATWKCLTEIGSPHFKPMTMFTHPTEDYDILLHLELPVLPRYSNSISPDLSLLTKSGFVNLTSTDLSQALPGFDPAWMFVQDVQRVYEGTLKVFYDIQGGSMIGLIWEPSLGQPRPFRVLGGFSPKPVVEKKGRGKSGDQMVTLNSDGIVREIQRMGAGLIRRIEQQ